MDGVKMLLLDPAPTPTKAVALRDGFVRSLRDLPLELHPCAEPPDRPRSDEISPCKSDVVFFIVPDGMLGHWLISLEQRGANPNDAPVIAVLNEHPPHEIAALLRNGVADFIMPPWSRNQVLPRVMRLLPRSRLLPALPSERPLPRQRAIERLVGHSRAFVTQLNKLPVLARCDVGVLIIGETGTGKEMFARAIHDLSARAEKPLVAVNCGSIPIELVESELFGHERGSFTGAYAAHRGLVAQADGGTLFLDEITSLPLLAQVKLLRFLQEKEYRPVGATGSRPADVRVIAAANTELESAVARGTFRQDLYYRLNVIQVPLPALRDRRDDIPVLAAHFLAASAGRFAREPLQLSSAALEKLVAYSWPGNVRELEHAIERTVVFSTSRVITAEDIALPDERATAPDEPFRQAKARTIASFERHYIETLLTAHRGNVSSAARRAGKNRRAFWELIRKHRIEVERFRLGDAPGGLDPLR